MSIKNTLIALAGLGLYAGASQAQVVINEVYENPPGDAQGNDNVLEFIELYGEPGMDLTGYAIGVFKGGSDGEFNPPNDIPDVYAELDEAFTLDGLSLGSNGFLVLYNGTDSQSLIPLFIPGQTTGVSFFDAHIQNPNDINGNLQNDYSSTYLLMRRRPHHSIVDGVSVYEPGYAIWKDENPDVDFDGKLDFGIEIPLNRDLGIPAAPPPAQMDPMQIIDEIAWSNAGGKEYVRTSQHEISSTEGFNPDAASRLRYFGANPMLGLRINSDGETVPTRVADESWIYGEVMGASIDFTYDPTLVGAPTDQGGDGFMDISIESAGDVFKITPGDFNDHAPTGITQFRFVPGDLDFDGDADADDLALFDAQLLEADFDATEDYIDPDSGMPIADPNNPGMNFQSYVFQNRLANAYLSARSLDPSDGSDSPSAADRMVLAGLVGPVMCNAADYAEPLGELNFFDVSAFLSLYNAADSAADLNGDGSFNFFDVSLFLSAYSNGCP
ncbi:MAG: hypothetical protein KDA29_07480 [Phycisphaerales bacterium]|nr:hypothetical protein [Phycisphaerales bacterium]